MTDFEDTMSELGVTVPDGLTMPVGSSIPLNLNDLMMERDNFFHSCWMRMKQLRPDLFQIMSEIELHISGLNPVGEDTDDDKSNAPKDDIL